MCLTVFIFFLVGFLIGFAGLLLKKLRCLSKFKAAFLAVACVIRIRRLYKVTPKLHESIEHTLQHLDNTAVERYKRQKAVRRFIIAFAVIASVVAFSTVAYATNLFGLLTEPVGKYGIDMHIAKGETTASTVSKQYAKPNPTYLPKGCCQLMGNDENENLSLTTRR